MSKHNLSTRFFLLLMIAASVLVSGSLTAAQGPPERGVVFYQGEEAVARLAELTGVSLDEARHLFYNGVEVGVEGVGEIGTDGVGGHFSFFVPNCVHPAHTGAYAVYDVSIGWHNVQFHGSDVWSGDYYCGSVSCRELASAGFYGSGEYISMYSVSAVWSWPVSHWCGTGVAAAQ